MRRTSWFLTGGGLLGLSALTFAPSPARTASGTCDELAGAVVINELLPNSPGSDNADWLELYNPGASDVTLTGWTLEYGTSTYSSAKSLSDVVIPAGGLVLIHDDGYTPDPSVTGYNLGINLGTGSNSDVVRIVDCLGEPVDTVVYSSDNNTDQWEDDSGAVATSFAPKPGEAESIGRRINGDDSDRSGDDFILYPVSEVTPGELNPVPFDCATNGEIDGLVINEIMTTPDTATPGEWIELLNVSDHALTLTGWTLNTGKGSYDKTYALDALTVPIGGFVLVHHPDFTPNASTLTMAVVLDLGNGDEADAVQLRNCDGAPVDTLVYGEENLDKFYDDTGNIAVSIATISGTGESIGRWVNGVDTDLSAEDFTVFDVSEVTPGFENPVPFDCATNGVLGGVVINELLPNSPGSDNADWLELYNPGAVDVTLTGWTLEYGTSTYSSAKSLSDVVIPAGGLVLIHDDGYTPDSGVTGYNLSINPGAGSDSDAVRIVNCLGEPVDTVVYGSDNSDDQWEDDSGAVATSFAPKPGETESIGRRMNGVDTNQSGDDFTVFDVIEVTPGYANPAPPPCDVSGNGLVLINEVLADAVGADAGQHWIELVNLGTADIDLGGWELQVAPSTWPNFGEGLSLPGGTILPAGGFLVIHEDATEFTNLPVGAPILVVAAGELDLGNGSSEDGLRLMDCGGNEADALAYGPTGTAGVEFDCGNAAFPTLAPAPGEAQTLGRAPEAADTNQCSDFTLQTTMSPGAENGDVCVPPDDVPKSGCRGRGSATTNPCDGTTVYEPPGRCATAPFGGLEAVVLALALIRRRRP